MLDNSPEIESCKSTAVDEVAMNGTKNVHDMAEKSIHILDDDEDSEQPEIIIDTVVEAIDVDDETNKDCSPSTAKEVRSVENGTSQQQDGNEVFCNVSKPMEFVIVSTASGSTVPFPDDVQIKDELDEPIATSCDPNDDEALENDPMGLLEINERSRANSTKSNVEQDDVVDDISSTCSSSVQTTESIVNISDWSKEYPWLLHEETDEWYGYCLYCDAKLSVRHAKSAKHHSMSLYHRERREHYLDFQKEQKKNKIGSTVEEIKEEFDTDSYVAALKLKRKSEAEAFNNYNWRRWLQECTWLERDIQGGTIGRCKYCSVPLNVEFTYLRQRHQDSSQHRENEKQYKTLQKRKTVDLEKETDEEEAESNDENRRRNTDDNADNENEASESDPWFLEVVDKNTARCILCETLIKIASFKRHLQTQLHVNNMKNSTLVTKMKAKRVVKTPSQIEIESKILANVSWQSCANLHAWLVADPKDESLAYCKYCQKRFLYASSAAKRSLHEHSFSHKANEKAYKEKQKNGAKQNSGQENADNESASDGVDENGGDENDEDEEEDAGDDEDAEEQEGTDEGDKNKEGSDEEDDNTDEQDDNSEDGKEEEDNEDDKAEEDNDEDESSQDGNKKKRLLQSEPEWYNKYPWCKKYKKNPNCCFCNYCKIPLLKNSRAKHNGSKRHIVAEANFLKRYGKKITNVVDQEFVWKADVKGHPNLYYCKYCRVRISTNYSKKQHSMSKIHLINEKLYNNQNKKETNNNAAEPRTSQTATPTPSSSRTRAEAADMRKIVVKEPSFISLIKQWQKKCTWLGYKLNELRTNYAYCKACEQSLYVRSFKNISKHQRSGKHIRIVNQIRRDRQKENEEKNKVQSENKNRQSEVNRNVTPNANANAADTSVTNQTENNEESINTINQVNNSIESLQKRYSWITKSKKADHAYCQYCDVDVPVLIIMLRNHTNSRSHRRSVVNFGTSKLKAEKEQNNESNAMDNDAEDDIADAETDNDVVLLTDNTEEILISEQDDNWTVKSENMDEHEALDRLLQRAEKGTHSNNTKPKRDERKNPFSMDGRPNAKRFKGSHSYKRLNETSNSSILSSILSTPLTLASCLGPLIQQQIQQVTNSQSQSSANLSATLNTSGPQTPLAVPQIKEPENTYDLFFKSVSETMKNLPVDLAAEGKVKVMQIICELELKALRRQHEQTFEHSISANISPSNSNFLETSVTNTQNNHSIVQSATFLNNSNCNPSEQSTEMNGGINGRIIRENTAHVSETVTTNIIESPPRQHQQQQQQQQQQHQLHSQVNQQQPSVSNASRATSTSNVSTTAKGNVTGGKTISPTNQAPIIGVMDMNGLQTLQLRNNMQAVKQMPQQNVKATVNNNQSTAGNTKAIRCIPFKNLSQNAIGDANTRIAHIQVPNMPATSTPTTQNCHYNNNSSASATSTPKGLINLRNIHITKRCGQPNHQHQTQTSSTVSVAMVNANADKSQKPTYVQATSQAQRWSTVNGSNMHTVGNIRPSHQVTPTTAHFQASSNPQNQNLRQYN